MKGWIGWQKYPPPRFRKGKRSGAVDFRTGKVNDNCVCKVKAVDEK